MKKKHLTKSTLMGLLLFLLLSFAGLHSFAAEIIQSTDTVKAGHPVQLQVEGYKGTVSWSADAPGVLLGISKMDSYYTPYKLVLSGKSYTIYNIASTPAMTMECPADAKVLFIPTRTCKITVMSGMDYISSRLTVKKQTMTGFRYATAEYDAKLSKEAGKAVYNLKICPVFADGSLVTALGNVTVSIVNDNGKNVFKDTYMMGNSEVATTITNYVPVGLYAEPGIKVGDCPTGKMTITYDGGVLGKITKTIKVANLPTPAFATKIKIDSSKTMTEGFAEQISVSLVNKNEILDGMTWTSSNPKIAKVNAKGKVTPLKKGECKITCTLHNGKKYTCKIKVKENRYKGYSLGKVNINSYMYGQVSIELSDIYYKNGALYTKWVAINRRIFSAVKYDWIKISLFSSNGKTIASMKFKNVPLNMRKMSKKYITFVFPKSAVKQKKVNLRSDDFTWKYKFYYSYKY